jgi:hypothetical protein
MSESISNIKTGRWGVVRRILAEPHPKKGWTVKVERSDQENAYPDQATAERAAMELGERYRPSIVIVRTEAGSSQSERVFLLKPSP